MSEFVSVSVRLVVNNSKDCFNIEYCRGSYTDCVCFDGFEPAESGSAENLGCVESDSTTTRWSTTTASTTTHSEGFFIEEFNGCCKTWRIRNGEFKAFCEHKRISHPGYWAYECIYDNGYDTGKSLTFRLLSELSYAMTYS